MSVDLSAPGSIATPDQIGPDPTLFEAANLPEPIKSGGRIEVGSPAVYEFLGSCGAKVLGTVNDVLWQTEQIVAPASLPKEWTSVVDANGNVTVVILITTDGPVADRNRERPHRHLHPRRFRRESQLPLVP